MKNKESKSFTKQIKRYVQVGGVVGGLATKIAGEKYLGLSYNNKNNTTGIIILIPLLIQM